MPSGAVVYWSRKFRRGRDYVPVWCPDCQEKRNTRVDETTRDGFTGLCTKCLDLRRSAAARREYPTADERLDNSCVVHWSEIFTGADSNLHVPVTCGDCQRKRTVLVKNTRKASFTGYCHKHRYLHTSAAPGTRRKTMNGYVEVKLAHDHLFYSMANKRGWVREHRVVMAERLGRPLASNETVHHKNGKRDDNRIENLELWSGNHPSGQRVVDSEDLATKILARLVQEMLEGRDW